MNSLNKAEGPEGGITYTIRVEEAGGERLDRYLAKKLPISRSGAAALIERGRVRIAEKPPKKSYIPEPDDIIVVEVPPPEPSTAVPEDIPIEVVFEDEWLLVVNKPAGMVVHPAPGHRQGTLVNALVHHIDRLSALGGVVRPGIVHRLDKDTSGLIIVAKDEGVHRKLSKALASRTIHRHYVAACWGHLDRDELIIEADISRHRRQRQRMAVVPGTRPAITRVERLESWRAADYLRVKLQTGRTHQIRVHLSHIGHPIAGDAAYGKGWERGMGGATARWAAEFAKLLQRQFLHASELEFEHPVENRILRFTAPLPGDLEAAARWARESS